MRRKASTSPPPDSRPDLRTLAQARSEALKAELRRLVRSHPLSEREINRRLGYSPAYLANLLGPAKGREPMPLRMDTYLALLEVLELDASELLSRVLTQHDEETAARGRGISSLELALARFEQELRARNTGPRMLSAEENGALVDGVVGMLRAVSAETGASLPPLP